MPEEFLRADLGIDGCTKPKRYFAAIIDNGIAFALIMAVALAITEDTSSDRELVRAIIGFSIFGIYFLYFFLFEALISTTPGKLVNSLRVRQLDGSKCSLKCATLRTLTRFPEINPCIPGCISGCRHCAALTSQAGLERQTCLYDRY